MPYPSDILSSRAVLRPGSYAVIPATGLVNNVVPGIENCRVSIVASPKMGAGFVWYVVTAEPGGGTTTPFAKEAGLESFVYCMSGEGVAAAGSEDHPLAAGSYVYAPAGTGLMFRNTGAATMRLLLYKQRYIPLAGHSARPVFGNTNDIPYRIYDEMENVLIKDLLPVDLGFDMNFHILSFLPGGSHGFVETHVQEHGAYVLKGEGCYYLDDKWQMIREDDFIWFGPYCAQASYGVGRGEFTYIYSKDCNRDAAI